MRAAAGGPLASMARVGFCLCAKVCINLWVYCCVWRFGWQRPGHWPSLLFVVSLSACVGGKGKGSDSGMNPPCHYFPPFPPWLPTNPAGGGERARGGAAAAHAGGAAAGAAPRGAPAPGRRRHRRIQLHAPGHRWACNLWQGKIHCTFSVRRTRHMLGLLAGDEQAYPQL